MKTALLFEKAGDSKVRCFLCAHKCLISDGHFGICGVRKNIEGTLYTFSYGRLIAANIDPVEKKPLYHFLPGTNSYSIATLGCNFMCGFCQNWQISQEKGKENEAAKFIKPSEIVASAIKSDCRSISYTYTEPTIFFEYALDIAKIAKESGLCNIFVTNGYMTKEALLMLKPYLDAANIDLKSFSDGFYTKVCGGRLSPVLDSIRLMHDLGVWVEITTLIIPHLNDSKEELEGIAAFIAGIDKNIPWHVSRFHPDYEMLDNIPTPIETLKLAKAIGEEKGLCYVYIGNVGEEESTYCPACKKPVIKRFIFDILENNLSVNRCKYCNFLIGGVY
ncbi:MAG: AmmeMemoRadiSam system radical SAM enzyme [Candidatus Omnitrophota bacterium]|nr:AmmeMemoRadiSam system radical SAM enzyme [Candidatus Omnitrophota bacterium]